MSRQTFMAEFGDLYERSPWVAGKVFDAGLDERHDVPGFLHEAFRAAVLGAGSLLQTRLVRAHPELAAGRGGLSEASAGEQAAAGLDACTAEEQAAFRELNRAYRERFGFPFVIAVKGRSAAQILKALRERLQNDPEQEFREALEQVCQIGKHRLAAKFNE